MEYRDFQIKVLGRTLQHLGVQTYKRRDVAIAELVANSWDANAENVWIEIPLPQDYSQSVSVVTIRDDGAGMVPDEVDDDYLAVGRNRRTSLGAVVNGRRVMGRKGIGKLAGFGIGDHLNILTWHGKESTNLNIDAAKLVTKAGEVGRIKFRGEVNFKTPKEFGKHGTKLTISRLRHPSSIDIEGLVQSISRRFSRTVHGAMTIHVNGNPVADPDIATWHRHPKSGWATDKLSDGNTVRFFYAFAKSTIKSPDLRGFTVHVNGKTAQAPPYFFGVEGTASGQHSTRYVFGTIEADFLDSESDDESDLVSTDRQELDWADPRTAALKLWGDVLCRRVLRECADGQGEELIKKVELDGDFVSRIGLLDPASRTQISGFLRTLGASDAAPDRLMDLADALVSAYEYRHFHDVVTEIEQVGDDPANLARLLTQIENWKVLESRAILEVIKGRIEIIDKFHGMIVKNAPETASKKSNDNMHDLIGGYPWLLHPDWQVLVEEKKVTLLLYEMYKKETKNSTDKERLDFLALSDQHQLVIVEIKRSNHPVSLLELQRLERYREELSAGNDNVQMALIYGGKHDVRKDNWEKWSNRSDLTLMSWGDVHKRTKRAYAHYRAVLEKDVRSPDFKGKESEVAAVRSAITTGTIRRSISQRRAGLGSQDNKFSK